MFYAEFFKIRSNGNYEKHEKFWSKCASQYKLTPTQSLHLYQCYILFQTYLEKKYCNNVHQISFQAFVIRKDIWRSIPITSQVFSIFLNDINCSGKMTAYYYFLLSFCRHKTPRCLSFIFHFLFRQALLFYCHITRNSFKLWWNNISKLSLIFC